MRARQRSSHEPVGQPVYDCEKLSPRTRTSPLKRKRFTTPSRALMRFWSSCVLVAALVVFSLMSLTSDFSELMVADDCEEASCAATALFCASEVALCRFESCCCVCWITASFCCNSVFNSCSCCACCCIISRIAAKSLCVTAGDLATVFLRVVFLVVVVEVVLLV